MDIVPDIFADRNNRYFAGPLAFNKKPGFQTALDLPSFVLRHDYAAYLLVPLHQEGEPLIFPIMACDKGKEKPSAVRSRRNEDTMKTTSRNLMMLEEGVL